MGSMETRLRGQSLMIDNLNETIAILRKELAATKPAPALREAVEKIPIGNHSGWNRYDTQNETVLSVFDGNGNTYDIRIPKAAITEEK